MINSEELEEFRKWKVSQLTLDDVVPLDIDLVEVGDTVLSTYPKYISVKPVVFSRATVISIKKDKDYGSGTMVKALFEGRKTNVNLDSSWFYIEKNKA